MNSIPSCHVQSPWILAICTFFKALSCLQLVSANMSMLFSSLKTHTLFVIMKLCCIKSQLFEEVNQM